MSFPGTISRKRERRASNGTASATTRPATTCAPWKSGELGFFYHSNIGLEVVGICEVCKLAHPNSNTDDERWECVDVRAVCELPIPVKLIDVKANPTLEKMSLVTSMRLSVQPVLADEWDEVCRMGGLDPKTIRK